MQWLSSNPLPSQCSLPHTWVIRCNLQMLKQDFLYPFPLKECYFFFLVPFLGLGRSLLKSWLEVHALTCWRLIPPPPDWALLRKHFSFSPWSACTINPQTESPWFSLRNHNFLHASTDVWVDFQLGCTCPLVLNPISSVWALRATSLHTLTSPAQFHHVPTSHHLQLS